MTTYRVRVEPLGRDVPCRDDQSILDACLREGVWLPHACTHGTCGTCKAQVLEGEVDHRGSSGFALMDFERDEGAALLCTATPRSDVVVEGDVDLEPGVEIHPVRDFAGRVSEVADVAPDVRRILVDLDEDLRFNPGQYVLVRIPGCDERRPYSLANPPSEPRRLELHVKRAPGGRCTDGWMFAGLAVGEAVDLSGPYGLFGLRPARPEPLLLLAGGTGLAPLKGIVRHVLETGLDRHVTLYHGVGTTAGLYDRQLLEELAGSHPGRFDYRPCVSREDWEGRRGRVDEVLAEDFTRCSGHVAYVCGPPRMVDAAVRTLMRKRLFPRDIYREDFYDLADKLAGGSPRPLGRGVSRP